MFEITRYNKLLQQHKNMVYNYSMYMLRNVMDADDVTQEVFIKIWDNMGKFRMSSAKAWIMKTTHNLCIDYLRKRKNAYKRELEIEDEQNKSFLSSDPNEIPDEIVNLKFIDNEINNAISKLPEYLKSVFVLYEIENMKYKEISQTLNIPLNTVKVYIMRARKRLQKELKEYEPS